MHVYYSVLLLFVGLVCVSNDSFCSCFRFLCRFVLVADSGLCFIMNVLDAFWSVLFRQCLEIGSDAFETTVATE